MSKIKLVILDIDDTLCLTEQTSFETENRIAIEMGFTPMTRGAHMKNWGKRIQDAIIERIPGIEVTEFMTRFIAENEILVKQGKLDNLSKDNLNTLKLLKTMGKTMVIVTSRTYGEVKHFLSKSHVIQNYVTDFYFDGNLKYLKPDPKVFQEILAKYNIDSHEAVYVGDSITDAKCAKSANLHFIAVLEGKIRVENDFKGIEVDFFAKSFSDLINYRELSNNKENSIQRYFQKEKLYVWPSKKVEQMKVINYFGNLFEFGKSYTEIQINSILLDNHSFGDPVFLRRELIDAGILSRTKDGKEYWKNNT